MLLIVDAPHLVACAVWDKGEDGWRCTRAAPILRWMVGLNGAAALARLRRLRYTWAWHPPADSGHTT